MGVKVREKPRGSGVCWIFISHKGYRKSRRVGDRKVAEMAARQIEARLTLGDMGCVQEDRQIKTFKEGQARFLKENFPSNPRRIREKLDQDRDSGHMQGIHKAGLPGAA